MSKIIDISSESYKKLFLSENDIINSFSNEEFETLKNSHLTKIYKKENYFNKNKKILPFKEIEKNVHTYFINLYCHDKDFYNIKVIDDIINNFDSHLVAEFKDYLIMGDDSEFLQKKYNIGECKKYLPTLFDYYKSCSVIFPNYVVLPESKYIFKNIRKKQKVIDNQQEQDDKKEKIKNGEINLDENEDFFNTKAFNSILNQTNTSNVKLFFGLNSKNKNNDSEETPNHIFNYIVKAEKVALAAKQNNILKKKNYKNILNSGYDLKTKINAYNMNNSKMIKKKKNNNLNARIINNKIKNIENNKNLNNHQNEYEKTSKIKIIYSNKNKIEKSKQIYKLNTSKRNLKSNTSIFETDVNEKLNKQILNRNNSSNKKIILKTNSNKKLFNIKNRKKKQIITNKELISKIIEKIKNSRSAVFNSHNSFHTIKQKKILLNIKENPTINSLSISPEAKINSYFHKCNNYSNGGRGIIISINESNSTPNIIKLKHINKKDFKEIPLNKNFRLKKGSKKDKMIKVTNNLNISPLNEIYLKKDFYNNSSTHTNIKANYNITSNNYDKKKNLTNISIKNKYNNKKSYKKTEKGNKEKINNFNLNIYKISPSSIAKKYITISILSSNKAVTISGMKPYDETKFGSIKVIKKKLLEKKIKQRTDINNNININININSNNIYNNTNQINSSNNNSNTNNMASLMQSNSISINNNEFDKRKFKELTRQSTENIQRNESHPMMKKNLLSTSNRNVFNFKKNFVFETTNKKKANLNINNTMTFSGYLTTRNSNNVSKKKTKMKNNVISGGKINYINNTNKFKKDGMIINKNRIPSLKNQKGNKK